MSPLDPSEMPLINVSPILVGEDAGQAAEQHDDQSAYRRAVFRSRACWTVSALCLLLVTLLAARGVDEHGANLRAPATPRSMLDCSWIPQDDCSNSDIYACGCRAEHPEGPCTPCDEVTTESICNKECCGGDCPPVVATTTTAASMTSQDGTCPEKYPKCYGDRDCVISAAAETSPREWTAAPTAETEPAGKYNYVLGYDADGAKCTGDFVQVMKEFSQQHFKSIDVNTTYIQKLLARGAGHEPRAPAEVRQEALNNLFCYTLVLPGSDERHLLVEAQKHRMGIYGDGCDGHQVYSSEPIRIGREMAHQVVGKDGAPLDMHVDSSAIGHLTPNAKIFATLWEYMLDQQDYQLYQWIVKVDADTVFLPDRLLEALRPLDHTKAIFIQNCPFEGQFLHGPMEVVSREGFSRLQIQKCQDLLHTEPTNREDWFFGKCLERNGVVAQALLGIMLETACPPYPRAGFDCFPYHAAYHPFKDPKNWSACLMQATWRDQIAA